MVNKIGEKLELYSAGIYSDDKATRTKAREEILRITDNFKKVFKVSDKDYPTWAKLREEMKYVKKNRDFTYAIDTKKNGQVIQSFDLTRQKPQTRIATPEANKPAYIITMPHCPKLQQTPNLAPIKKQIELIQTESFGTTAEASKAESSLRLRVVIGVNRAQSIDSKVNKLFVKYLDALDTISDQNVHFTGFLWAPVWNKDTHTHVKRLFKLIKAFDKDIAENIMQNLDKPPVPYQNIREEIKKDPITLENALALRRGAVTRPEFIAVMDDDAVHLRKGNDKGLFSHYDDLIRDNPEVKIATTGYRMIDSKYNFVQLASETDLVARRALAQYIPTAAYFPEPNLIYRIKVPTQANLSRMSFLRKTAAARGGNLESLGLMEKSGYLKKHKKGEIVYGLAGEIQTTASPKISIPQKLKKTIKPVDIKDSETLASFRKFLQSSIHPLNCAKNICKTLPGNCASGANSGNVSRILTTFDPKEMAHYVSNWLELYPAITTAIFDAFLTYDLTDDADYLNIAQSILDEFEDEITDVKRLKTFIKSSTDILHQAFEDLENNGIENNDLYRIIRATRYMGHSVYNFWKSKINNTAFAYPELV